jgi:Flp pilus assembly protein TadD
MAGDEDLSALLPEPPPPRNTRRDAAIEAAMLRFDGREPAPAVAPLRPVRPASRWSLLGRPQFGALLTAALVGVIAVPIWLSNGDHLTPKSQSTQPAAQKTVPAAPPAMPSPAAQPSAAQIARVDTPPANPSPPVREGSSPAAKPVAMGQVAEVAAEALPPPPAEPMPVFAPAPPPPPPEPAPAPTQMAARSADARDEAEAVVVTGSRMAPLGFARRAEAKRARSVARAAGNGAWDACTVRDSAQNLAACKKLVDPSASGRKGRAAAQVADGLSAAWRGDSDAAIAAFDRAIDQSPGLAFAWLNRGLAREQKGDTDRALADLNKAVRLAPNIARNYYQRSLFLSRQGETRRAREDWERAIRIDPRLEDADE